MGRLRRIGVGLLAAVVVSAGVVALDESPAAARKVGNPGTGFVFKVQQGMLRIKGESFDFNDENRLPQCSDGKNNDDSQDSAVDYPADPQCANANDDSETAGGNQTKQPIQLTNGTINANGTFSFSGVSFPRQYMYVADVPIVDPFVVNIDVVALGPATGTINPATGAMTLSLSVEVRASGGQLNSGCKIGPINLTTMTTGTTSPPGPNTPISGVPYNPGTGRATLVQNSFSVPGASGCTATFLNVNVNSEINSALGLPSTAGNNEATFLGEFVQSGADPQPGVVASFTTSPSSGTAPLTVGFNAGASSGAGILTYQWDFTNNGSFDATGQTTSFTYTSGGTYTARLRVTDGDGDTAETTRTINVGANLPPTATDKTVTLPEDSIAFPITLTGTDPENGPLTFTRVAPNPANGSVSCSGADCTYTPNPNFHGTDSFGFRVTDNAPSFDNGVITLNVTPVNDAPVASDVSATVLEDGSTDVHLSASDVDGEPLTYEIVSPPTLGDLSGSGATRTYTPAPNANGIDTFTYRASDGTADSNLATATITITPVNDPPTAVDQVGPDAVHVPEDGTVAITLSGSDAADGNAVSYGIVTAPSHGSLSGSLPNLVYTPAANYHGPDSLVFRVTDPDGASDTGTVEIIVDPVNDAPTTANLNVGTNEDEPVDVTIPGADLDGDELTFTPSSPTAGGGTVTCDGPVCTYSPASGFAGTDSFTVEVSDGEATVTSTVTVIVTAFNNNAPVVSTTSVILVEDSTRSSTLGTTDVDGDTVTHTVVGQPALGTLTCDAAGSCTFVPNPDASGSTTATVLADDGRGGVTTATIAFTIVGVNDAPSVPDQDVVTAEDTAAAFTLVGSDPDGDELTWSVKVAPSRGSLSCDAAGACTYTPAANASGADAFEVEASDGRGGRTRIVLPVVVTAVDDPPTAGAVSTSVTEDGSTSFTVPAGDPDGDVVTVTAAAAGSGTLSCSTSGACTFVAAPDATGTETVAYTVDDGTSTVTGTITITIVPVNDAPVAVDQDLTTAEDTPVEVVLTASDPDGEALTYSVLSAPAQGVLGGIAPNLVYVPAPNASGTVTLTFRATDAAGASDTGTITITVTPVDDAPVAGNPTVTLAEDSSKAIALTGSDEEGPVTFTVTTPPTHGAYVGGVYTPDANYHGPDSIGYAVTSNTGQVVAGVVSIVVTPVNDAPIAHDLAVSTTRTAPVALTLTASDWDGQATLTFAVVTPPTKGTLTGTAPNLTYTPTGFVTGSDSFTFKVTDSAGAVDSGTVRISIGAGAALPTVLTLAPADVERPGLLAGLLGGKNTYTGLKGTLTTTGGLAVAGKVVKFTVDGQQICQATTGADGVATCDGKGKNVAATQYVGAFAGDAGFAATTGTGALS